MKIHREFVEVPLKSCGWHDNHVIKVISKAARPDSSFPRIHVNHY